MTAKTNVNKRITWKIETRKLVDLKPHPKNPREFTEKGMKDLENSINSIGFMQPININQDGIILSGHARTLKLKQMGETEVDVYVPDRVLTPKQEDEVLVRANANTAGKWDFDILANEFEDFELVEWGLEIPELTPEIDLSLLDEEDLSSQMADMADGVRKAIQIEFEPHHYEEAFELVKFWRNQGVYVGKMLIDLLKTKQKTL